MVQLRAVPAPGYNRFVPNVIYNRAKFLLATGALDLVTNDIRVLLTTSTYVPNPDHNFVSDVTNELVGAGYARQALAGKTVTEDDANDLAYFDADDATWLGINAGTAARIVIFKFVTNDADSPLVASLDLLPSVLTNGNDMTVVWAGNGILRVV